MTQFQARWKPLPRGLDDGNLSVGRSLVSQMTEQAHEERAIVTLTGSPEDVQQLVEANERMAFLLAVSTELARIVSPQEVVCTAMARLRERLGVERVTLAEIDTARNEAVHLRESGDPESRIEIASVPLEPFAELAAESRQGLVTVIRNTRTDHRAAHLYEEWYAPEGAGAVISVPIMEKSGLVAILTTVSASTRNWTDSDVALVRSVADILWPALEKARAERRVTMNEERLRLAQGVAQIGTWDWDPETRRAFFSPECKDILGISSDETAVEEWQRNVDAQQLPAVYAMLEQCTTTGMGEIEYRYRHPARGLCWIYHKAGLVQHAGHRHVVGISLDVTPRRQAEEALKEVNQRKDEFLAMLAHELRNPLAPIRNAAQLLSAHGGKPEIEWARAVIERQTKHLVRLVDDLLDVSRMVRGQITLQREPVTLAEIVQTAVETSRPLIRRRKHHFAVVLPEGEVLIEGDLTRLAQVISNLLNNAAKYTDDGGHIRLDAELDSGMINVRVRDTGLGVAPNLLPHVFDLFTQADRTLDRAEGGLGIGLTLVKRLVELHGGNVEARSEGLGRGAEFIVRLPVLGAQSTAPERPRKSDVGNAEGLERSLRILIVDDNVDAADSVAMLLGMEGHQTRTVNTARAALLAAPEFEPEVVLLDIGLPEMDGYEVARRLRAQNGAHLMRLVAVTGYGQPADRRRAQAAGFDEHMVKPVEPSALQAFLRTVPTSRAS
jgi:signal transduction histidine kinase/ActR/RegA family two-component response regulator